MLALNPQAASTAKVSTMTSSSTWVSILAAAMLWAAPTPASAQVCSDPALLRFALQSTPAHVCSDPALQSVDVDEDGVCDVDDTFPNDPCESMDKDKNGIGDNEDMLWAEQQARFISIATRTKPASLQRDGNRPTTRQELAFLFWRCFVAAQLASVLPQPFLPCFHPICSGSVRQIAPN